MHYSKTKKNINGFSSPKLPIGLTNREIFAMMANNCNLIVRQVYYRHILLGLIVQLLFAGRQLSPKGHTLAILLEEQGALPL